MARKHLEGHSSPSIIMETQGETTMTCAPHLAVAESRKTDPTQRQVRTEKGEYLYAAGVK
jgi:hypothetical protein